MESNVFKENEQKNDDLYYNIKDENEQVNKCSLYRRKEKDEIGVESENNLCEKFEKVSQLELEVDALFEENSELFLLLQNERRKSKQLESELEHGNMQGGTSEQGLTEDALSDFAHGQQISNDFLHKVVVTLKEKLDTKESECEELEDKLSVMDQEFAAQGEELARVTIEYKHELKHLHELLAQERDLNNLLSEESDQTVRELETRIQEKDEINTELKFIQDETSERIQSIKDECRYYQTKLHDTETRLRSITNEHEQSTIETDSVSCQVSESELKTFEETKNESRESNAFEKIFSALWDRGDVIDLNETGNASRYTMDIFNLIRNGFKNLKCYQK